MKITREKVERMIELFEKFKSTQREIEKQLEAAGKDQIEIAMHLINHNYGEIELFDYINNLSKVEKDDLCVLFHFGQIFYNPTKEDFEFCKKNERYHSKQDIYDMLDKSLSKYLRNALMKLDVMNLNN